MLDREIRRRENLDDVADENPNEIPYLQSRRALCEADAGPVLSSARVRVRFRRPESAAWVEHSFDCRFARCAGDSVCNTCFARFAIRAFCSHVMFVSRFHFGTCSKQITWTSRNTSFKAGAVRGESARWHCVLPHFAFSRVAITGACACEVGWVAR